MILWDKVVSLNGDWVSRKEAEEYIRELEVKLCEAKALPEKWREKGLDSDGWRYYHCADELESCLSGNIDNEVKR